MANKKVLERLVSGVVGEQPERGEVPQDVIEELHVSDELREALNKERTKDTGRPKKGERTSMEKGAKQGETRATFIVNKESLRKIKYISLMDTKQIKDVVGEALNAYFAKWEEENGTITLPKKIK